MVKYKMLQTIKQLLNFPHIDILNTLSNIALPPSLWTDIVKEQLQFYGVLLHQLANYV